MSELWRKETTKEQQDFLDKHGVYWFVDAITAIVMMDAKILDPSFYERVHVPYTEEERDLLRPSVTGKAFEMIASNAGGVCDEVRRAADLHDVATSNTLRYYFMKNDFFYTDD